MNTFRRSTLRRRRAADAYTQVLKRTDPSRLKLQRSNRNSPARKNGNRGVLLKNDKAVAAVHWV